jgi:hypothetical protein
MGLSKKKQTTDTTQTQQNQATTTPNVPDWISQPAQNIAGGINSMIGQGASTYAPQTNALQQKTWADAANLPSYGGTDFSGAEGAIGKIGPVENQSLLTGLDQYYTPFKDQVLNPVLNDYDTQSGITRAAQAAAGAKNSAFQGSRYGVQEAATEGELARGRAATEGGLLDRLYTSATGLSADDANRRQQAGVTNQQGQISQAQLQQSLAGMRSQEGMGIADDARARLALQAGLGQQQYEQENAARQFPIEYQRQMAGLLQGLNPALYTGQDVTGTSSGTGKSTTTANQGMGAWFGDLLTASAASAAKGATMAI